MCLDGFFPVFDTVYIFDKKLDKVNPFPLTLLYTMAPVDIWVQQINR